MSENKRNYQKELDRIIDSIKEKSIRPKLLLHACCAPCSSYCLEYLSQYFDITIYYYNPNIEPEEEFDYRVSELKRLISEMPEAAGVKLVVPMYDNSEFKNVVKGLEEEPERGARCTVCYSLRLRKTAEYAAEYGFDYFSTTLSISPYKDADRLVSLGEHFAKVYGVCYLTSDFKKRNGYKRSIELSEEYKLYRQDFCGCIYSKRETEAKRNVCENQPNT
ncbi:MAG: epoxyqueuosine reductase QueH [Lachnospiraceae bacterium]|nr:epoxyqueuosine reductase QueH [Lachnospiraceae bacterium]